MPVVTPIYLDNHATTRVDPRVVEAMLPCFSEQFGNANSIGHPFGEQARQFVDDARASLAAGINADPAELVFTSGATESNNLAIRGVAEQKRRRGDHLVSVRTEHAAVLDPLKKLAARGFEVTLLEVAQHGAPLAGRLDPQQVAEAIRDDTALVSVMLANNEIGTVQPLAEIAAICQQREVLLHCDATQAVGKVPVDVEQLGVDLLSFTAHKLYGPKGVGALVVRRKRPAIRLAPQISGGGQQGGRRSGTLNVPGIVGFAKALELCLAELPDEAERLSALRNRLYQGLLTQIDDAGLNSIELCGPRLEEGAEFRLPNNLNVAFPGLDGEALMLEMPEIAVSSGAACASADPGPSHVLLALGMPEDQARSTLRFGLGRFNTEAEIDFTIQCVVAAVRRLRNLA